MQTYYTYCTSQEKHPNEVLGEPELYKFKPADVVEDGLDLDKCPIEAYVLHYYKLDWSLHAIEEQMSTARQSQFFTKLPAIKKMIYNYESWHNDNTVHHDIDTFKSCAVEAVQDVWDPYKQTLVLRGPPNMGKTELAKAMMLAGL